MKKTQGSFILTTAFFMLIGGSLWGFSEVVIGDIIRTEGIPLRAGILTGIGFLIMGILSGAFRKAGYLLLAALPAVLIVQMGVFLCGNSVLCKANSCVALACHTGMLAAGYRITGMGKSRSSFTKTALLGSAAALSSAVAFYFIGMRCAPCPYLLSFNSAAGFVSYLYAEALPWMIFSGAGFSAGHFIGTGQYEGSGIFSVNMRVPHYITGAAAALACWALSAGVIMG